MLRFILIAVAVLLAPSGWAQDKDLLESSPAMVIGPRNLDLHKGAELLLAGRTKEGIELTIRGLRAAAGRLEEEAALSNLCSGHLVLGQFGEALKFCELLLARNDKSWQGYNKVVSSRPLTYREKIEVFKRTIRREGFSIRKSVFTLLLLGFGGLSYEFGRLRPLVTSAAPTESRTPPR